MDYAVTDLNFILGERKKKKKKERTAAGNADM